LSQVIVTNDQLKPQRDLTRWQERDIDRDGQFKRWKRSDIVSRGDPVKILIGLAVLPVLALWGILAGIMAVAVAIVNFVFKGLGAVVGGKKNLNRA
jgi:hypothetical protein